MVTQPVALDPVDHRFTVEEYEQLGEAGILDENSRVELVDGRILDMTPIGTRHGSCVMRLTRLFSAVLANEALLSVQNPAVVGSHSEPQPDFAVLKARPDFYGKAHPRPPDVLLLVEVADTSLRLDRMVKLPIYAAGGVAEYWIVDLNGEVIEVHREPTGNTYAARRVATRGESINPLAFPDLAVAVSDVLG